MITLIILASVSMALIIDWEFIPALVRKIKPKTFVLHKPFNCPPCMSIWIGFILSFFGGLDFFTIFTLGISNYLITTISLWILDN